MRERDLLYFGFTPSFKEALLGFGELYLSLCFN